MALKEGRTKTVGHLPRDAVVRVDKRVKEILARQEALLPPKGALGQRVLSAARASSTVDPREWAAKLGQGR